MNCCSGSHVSRNGGAPLQGACKGNTASVIVFDVFDATSEDVNGIVTNISLF